MAWPKNFPRLARKLSNLPNAALMGLGLALTAWLAASMHAIVVSGPAARAAAIEREADELAAENREFCTRFGMPPGSRDFLPCHEALLEMRAKHEQRLAAQLEGTL